METDDKSTPKATPVTQRVRIVGAGLILLLLGALIVVFFGGLLSGL